MNDPRPRLTARDFDPEVLMVFDQYVHGDIDRRTFLERLGKFAAGTVTAAALFGALQPRFAAATQVPTDDGRLKAEYVEYDSPKGYGRARGYLVRPAKPAGKLPLVLVVHENRGLNPHIEDVARRVAVADYVAFAPDALFPLGGYPGDEDQARALFQKLETPKSFEDFVAALDFLRAREDGNGRLGVVGFCYGGGMANRLAAAVPDLKAAVPYYGPGLQEPDAAAGIRAELLLHFASNDERVNTTWPPYEAALQKAGVQYSAHFYPDTQHGFHNDTTPRYDADAAKLSWDRTLAFFARTLKG